MKTTKLTKKQLTERVEMLEQQLADSRERNAGFNKYKFVADLEDEIKREIEKGNIEDEDEIREYIERDIENACIYTKDCYDICQELNVYDFDDTQFGEAKTISQLAYYELYDYVYSEINISELEELIEVKQNPVED